MTTSARHGMTPRQTAFVIALTAAYLVVELAFNARLLDVAGGLQADAVHGLENFGRALTGVAVALFVLQRQLARRAGAGNGGPRTLAIVFWCLLSAVLTFAVLKLAVDMLVDASSGRFRKAASTLVVVRSEMLNGSARLDGLADDPELFKRPEGKAFAALFPVLAVPIWERVDQRLAPVKQDLMMRAIGGRLGGAEGFYMGPFGAALQQLRQAYHGDLPEAQLQQIFQKEFDSAWADYSRRLQQHRWTPDTVPYRHQQRVAAEMNRKVGVPRNWSLGDRATFRAAVERQVRRRLQDHPGTVYDNGRAVASGLAWPAYVAHPANQARLQQALQVPSTVAVRHEYASGKDFEERLYLPMLKASSTAELACLDLAEHSFLPGGENQARGREAAQAVIVPPIALLCSLLGAITHLAKLLYQLTRLGMLAVPRLAKYHSRAILVPVAVVLGAAGVLAVLDNAVTRSRVHRFIQQQAMAAETSPAEALAVRAFLAAMHAVEIGQGYGYPVNNFVRTRVLGGVEFNLGGRPRKDSAPPSPRGPDGMCHPTDRPDTLGKEPR